MVLLVHMLGIFFGCCINGPMYLLACCESFFFFLSGLAEDDQDSVRLQTVDNCSALARVLPPEGQKEHVLPVVLDTSKDKRVEFFESGLRKAVWLLGHTCRACVEERKENSLDDTI